MNKSKNVCGEGFVDRTKPSRQRRSEKCSRGETINEDDSPSWIAGSWWGWPWLLDLSNKWRGSFTPIYQLLVYSHSKAAHQLWWGQVYKEWRTAEWPPNGSETGPIIGPGFQVTARLAHPTTFVVFAAAPLNSK